MLKKGLTVAAIGILAVGLVVGSLYAVLRPEQAHAEGGQGGCREKTAVVEAEGAGCHDDEGRGQAACDEEHDERHACEGKEGQGRESRALAGKGEGSGRGCAAGDRSTFDCGATRQGRAGSEGSGLGTGSGWYEREGLEWVTIEGEVVGVNEGEIRILTSEGREIEVHTGPEWYREDSGYGVSVGDQLRVTGNDHDDEFAVGQIENLTTGEVITLRDEEGRPGWAGRGWRQQS